MTQNSKRIAVILSVLILVIGFAAVTTTLVLNGGLLISESDDFKIIFTEAILDGRKDNSLISNDKKTITFESKELLDLNDRTTLEYMVANTSRNYDANVSVNCSISSNTSEYVYVRNNPSEMIVEAGTSKKGTIEVELIKVLTESKEVSLTCELVSTPIERDNLANEYTEPEKEPFSEAGTIKSISSYYESNMGYFVPSSVDFWKYAYMISKVVFEDTLTSHETSDDLIFDVSAENSSNKVMAYLVANEKPYGGKHLYDLYIQSETGVKANSDSSNLFLQFSSLEEIVGLEHFDTSGVTNMSYMFSCCEMLTSLNLSKFDTSNVSNMSSMFYGCSSLTKLDVGNFDTSNVNSMSEMFHYCWSFIDLDLGNFDTKNVTNMSGMFSYCRSLASLDLSNFDTSNVTDMSGMFSDCSSLASLDISKFDTSNVTLEGNMFFGMPDNAKVYVKDIASQEWILNLQGSDRPSSWTTENVVVKV